MRAVREAARAELLRELREARASRAARLDARHIWASWRVRQLEREAIDLIHRSSVEGAVWRYNHTLEGLS